MVCSIQNRELHAGIHLRKQGYFHMVHILSHTVLCDGLVVQVWFQGTLVGCGDTDILQFLLVDSDSLPLLPRTPAVFPQ